MKKFALADVTEDLPKYLRMAEEEEVVITKDGKPAGVLIGFRSEDDWLDFQLEEDPRFLERIEASRQSLREGKGVRLEDVPDGAAEAAATSGPTARRRRSRPHE